MGDQMEFAIGDPVEVLFPDGSWNSATVVHRWREIKASFVRDISAGSTECFSTRYVVAGPDPHYGIECIFTMKPEATHIHKVAS